jgi:acyl-coenzyme A thioesterase PaaI-like protein
MGCGADHPTGLRLRMVVGEGWTVHADVTLGEHHQGAPGLAHGGMLAAALDEALGGLGWLLQAPMVTGRLQVEYLRPVRIGTTVRIVAQAVAVQGRRTYCQAYARDVADLDGGDLARAFAVFVLVPLEHFRRHGRSMPTTARTWEVNP